MSMEMNISETIQKCNFNEGESKNYGYELLIKIYACSPLTVETRYRT